MRRKAKSIGKVTTTELRRFAFRICD